MNRFTHFIFYNNTIPLLFGVLFLGAGATFAASPEAGDCQTTKDYFLVLTKK